MTATSARTEFLPLAKILAQFPDSWVYLGDPMLKDENLQTALLDNLVGGIVIGHASDKRELAQLVSARKQGFSTFACIYTGKLPKTRKFWL